MIGIISLRSSAKLRNFALQSSFSAHVPKKARAFEKYMFKNKNEKNERKNKTNRIQRLKKYEKLRH